MHTPSVIVCTFAFFVPDEPLAYALTMPDAATSTNAIVPSNNAFLLIFISASFS